MSGCRKLLLVSFSVLLSVVVLPVTAASAAEQLGQRVLKEGNRGPDVKKAQELLNVVGVSTRKNGVYTRGTKEAVRRFERRAGRQVNGVLCKGDASALRQAVAKKIARNNVQRDPSGGAAPGKSQVGQQAQANRGVAAKSPAPNPNSGGVAPMSLSTLPGPVVQARVGGDGLVIAPLSAPEAVKQMIAAANRIHSKPYAYAGGHRRFEDTHYDCSGSVSYALRGAGVLKGALHSGGLMNWGEAGVGKWVTVYTNPRHAFMVIAGIRFDTGYRDRSEKSRWSLKARPSGGYVARHPRGL